MCNLYSMTATVDEMKRLFDAHGMRLLGPGVAWDD